MSKTRDIKVVLLGDSGVGKTSILNRFASKKFDDNSMTTLGASFVPKIIVKGEMTYKFQIWDTAGQEKYRSLAPLYYRDSHAALVVYDITSKQSFEVLKVWVKELRDNGPSNIQIAVVGNKMDLIEKEEVQYEQASKYAKELNAIFQLTSAKRNENIESLFLEIAEKIEERDSPQKKPSPKDVNIHNPAPAPAKKGCC